MTKIKFISILGLLLIATNIAAQQRTDMVVYGEQGSELFRTNVENIDSIKFVADDENLPYGDCIEIDVDTIYLTEICYFCICVDSCPSEYIGYSVIVYYGEGNPYYIEGTALLRSPSGSPTGDTDYRGEICNFPDFAKEWENGIIYYEGILYIQGRYTETEGGQFILTKLRKIE